MFTENEQVIDRSKLVIISMPVNVPANTRIYFPTDGYLSSKRITGLLYIYDEMSAALSINGASNNRLVNPAKYFTITLLEKGTSKILIENSPLLAFANITGTSPYSPIKRLDSVNISFQDSYITYLGVGVGFAASIGVFKFFYS